MKHTAAPDGLVKIEVTKQFDLLLDNNKTVKFVAGTHFVAPEIANHWYVKAHLKDAPPPEAPVGTLEYAEARRAELREAQERAQALQEEISALEEAAKTKQAADQTMQTITRITANAEKAQEIVEEESTRKPRLRPKLAKR